MKKIVIIGAGGVGKETAFIIEQINKAAPAWEILGFLDDFTRLHNTLVNGYKVLGGIDEIESLEDVYAVCAIASYQVKSRIVDRIQKLKAKFATIIHPSVYVCPTNSVGEGSIIYPGVIMTTNIKIGSHVILSPGCGIGHESVIEDYSSILWNASIAGNVRIGEGCFVGTGATIIQNVNIGQETVIGAGAVVLIDLPQKCTAVGVPAKIIKS